MITRVLLIEDNEGHARLVQEAFKRCNGGIDFHQASNGEEAFQWLVGCRPDVILLDLNLPGMYGLDVLKRLKADAVLMSIPVIILTTSKVEQDIVESYKSQAACYIIKPLNYEKWTEAVSYISGLYKMSAKVRK